jgi:hypothetical protein
VSPVEDRIVRLEEWRIASERTAERTLARLGELARGLERHAAAVDRFGQRLEAVTAEIAEERARRRERGRLRRIAMGIAALGTSVVGVMVDRGVR